MDSEQMEAKKKLELAEKRQGDLVIFLTLIVICTGWLVLTFMIPVVVTKLTWPGLLPTILLSLIIILSVEFLLSTYPRNPEYCNLRDLFRRGLLMVQNIRGLFFRGVLTLACLAVYYLMLKYLPHLLPRDCR